MHEASDLFKKAISQKHRELRIRATIEGKEYSGWSEIQSCNIEESILTDEEFKFGSATASSFDLTLTNMDESLTARSFEGKEVQIEIGVQLDKFKKPFEYVSMGFFIVEEASKEKNTIQLSGFDKMILFEKPYVTELTYPATLKQIFIEICTQAGVPFESASFINDDYVVRNKPELEAVTLRVALEYVSELACGFARINRRNRLEIVTLQESPLIIDQSNYYQMNLSEYEYGPIDYVAINNEGIVEDIGNGDNILEIHENIFTYNPNEQLLLNIFNAVRNFKFKPFTSTWQGNPLTAPGDVIEVAYKENETYQSFIAKQKFSFENGLKCDIETNAKTQMQIDYETKGHVTAKMQKVRASIKNMGDSIRLEVEEVDKSVAGLEVRVGEVEIYASELDQSIAQVNVKADNISLSVSDLSGRMGNAESRINIQANQIESKVSETDYNGNTIINRINQTSTTTTIDARNIYLLGITNVASRLTLGTGYNSDASISFKGAAISIDTWGDTLRLNAPDIYMYGRVHFTQGATGIDVPSAPRLAAHQYGASVSFAGNGNMTWVVNGQAFTYAPI